MEYLLTEIKVEIGKEKDLKKIVADKLKIKEEDFTSFFIQRKSIDSRREVCFSFNVVFSVKNNVKINKKSLKTYKKSQILIKKTLKKENIVIVGSGPSGLFAALFLARAGHNVTILEQGKCAFERQKDVEKFWKTSVLNEKSNVQFGHGGAGTFSDGKVGSGISSPLCQNVLEELVLHGAGEEIKYDSHPHIGTDVLISVLENIQKEIESLGGKFLFEHTFLDYEEEDGKVSKAVVETKEETVKIEANKILLCVGNSARKTFEKLYEKGVNLKAKPLSIGLRIQHKQSDISKNQYKDKWDKLPPAPYKLSCFLENGRCVYTFCMCPGGYVVNASSEIGGVVCNGMSYSKRDSENANSALLVNVSVEDFEDDALGGIRFQEKWEREAFKLTNGKLPIQTFGDFLEGKVSTEFGEIKPVVKGEYVFADLNKCLPKFASDSIKQGILEFDKKIKGFARKDAILVGVETRSSCPVRILRNENFETNIKGIYSCGEGAGYAGGILSSAVDGVKLALCLLDNE